MRRRTITLLVAVATAAGALAFASPARADGYIDCMDSAIRHRDALIGDGWTYDEAQRHYYEHTRGCYSWYYLGGPHIIYWGSPWPIEWPSVW